MGLNGTPSMAFTSVTRMAPPSNPAPSDSARADFYSQVEVQQILQVAIARQAQAGELEQLTRAQLLEIADEMGISAGELQIAEQEWQVQQGDAVERQEFDRLRSSRFQRRVTRYLIVNGFSAAIALLVTGGGGLLWAPYLALGWGMGVALDAWNTFYSGGDRYEDAFQRWRRKRLLRRSIHSLFDRWFKR